MASYRGSCLCGEIEYEALGPLNGAHHCHCIYCRKFHGTPHATGAMATGRRWLRGERSVASFESSPGFHRFFCRHCGSGLPGDPAAGFSWVPFGTLDTVPEARPYRFGYGVLDADLDGQPDPGARQIYFEISDYSTSYVFYENPR